MSTLIIAIDGPSASGKSTVSQQVAALLNYHYVDSGSLYRGITWQVIKAGISYEQKNDIVQLLEKLHLDFFIKSGSIRFTIDEVYPGKVLRSKHVRDKVSYIAEIPQVRTWIVCHLRNMTRFGSLVMEGRDIGTVVFPHAEFKFYLNADIEARAKRRHNEIKQKKEKSQLMEVKNSLFQRDKLDSSRYIAPLKIAPDAEVIDTTKMTVQDVVNHIVQIVRSKS